MVMHARKHIRLDGYFDRNQTHSYENSSGKYSKSSFGDNCNDKSPAVDSGATNMDSPENSRRPSPRYLHKASYAQRLKERDHHHEIKSPMSKERSNRSREHSHHHHTSSSQHHGQQSNSTPGTSNSSRNKSSSGPSENATSNYARSNHDRSHVEVKMEPEKERKGQVGDWSEHVSSSGKKYYYNCRTEVSQWEKPREWVEFEKVHGITKTAEAPNKPKEKSSSATPSKGLDRHSNSNSRSSANTSSRNTSQHHSSSSSHPQRESHSHSHRHDRSHQSSSNRSHSGNDQRTVDQASSASSSSSNSSNSSNSSASANRASAGTARNSGRREDRPVSRSGGAQTEEASEKSDGRLNDHGGSSRQELQGSSNHHQNYHSHHNSANSSSSHKRSSGRKDSAQDMDISPDSSFSVDNSNFSSSTGRETPRSHQYHQQHHSSSHHQQLTPTGNSSTPGRGSKSGGSNYFASTPSAMTTPNQSTIASSTPTNNSISSQLLSPSQVTLANLPRLISQLTGTRGLPNLSEMSQQEALQTVQQALQLTKQLGSEGSRIDCNTRGTTGLSPSSDFHSHSSRQTSPASSNGSPTSVSVTVNSSSSNVTSVAAAMAAAAAANSGGSLSSAVSLKLSTPSLTPSLANYFRDDLVSHVTGWQADHAERQASRYSEEAHNIGSLNSTRVSAELKMARSLVRLAEIQATLQEQRILFLRQQVKELEDRRSQNSFMMDS